MPTASHHLTQSVQLTHSAGRLSLSASPLNCDWLYPVTAWYCGWVTSYLPIRNGLAIVTTCVGSSLGSCPGWAAGDPIVNDPAGTRTNCIVCPLPRSIVGPAAGAVAGAVAGGAAAGGAAVDGVAGSGNSPARAASGVAARRIVRRRRVGFMGLTYRRPDGGREDRRSRRAVYFAAGGVGRVAGWAYERTVSHATSCRKPAVAGDRSTYTVPASSTWPVSPCGLRCRNRL